MRTKTTTAIDEQLWQRFKAMCALMNLWPSHVLEDFIEQWLKRNEAKARKEAAGHDR